MSYNLVNHGFLVEAYVVDEEGADVIDISGSILDIMVRKRFIDDCFPLVVIDMRTTEDIRNHIRDIDCKIKLRISYYDLDKEASIESTDTAIMAEKGIVFENLIRIYDKPYTTTAAKHEEENGETISQTESAPFIYYRVSGVPENCLQVNQGTFNIIYKDAEVSDALVNMISSVYNGKTIIQETQNKTVYNNILITPNNLIPAITQLNNYYGLYNTLSNVFMDFDTLYCYSPTSSAVPSSNLIEYNVINPDSTGNQTALQPNIDEDNNVKLTSKVLPEFKDASDIVEHMFGNETVFFSYDEYFDTNIRERNNNDAYQKVRYVWNGDGAKRNEDAYYATMKDNKSISIAVNNLNPELFNPLTKLRFEV